MKIEKWTLIVESVGTIAIVASLLVLVIQVRDNTEVTRTASFDAMTQSNNDWRSDLLNNPELFELYYNFREGVIPPRKEDGIKNIKLVMLLINLFTNHNRAYIAYQNRLDSDEWDRIRRGLCSDRASLQRANNDELRDRIFALLTTEFVAYMENNCKDSKF